jgi:thiol-disulfide isomerase/thioredoxin
MPRFFLILSVFVITSCNSHKASKNTSESTYSIKGRIDGRDTGWIFLGRDDTTGQSSMIVLDSTKISGSDFYFHDDLENPFIGKMMIKIDEAYSSYTPYFALDTGVTNVHLYNDSMTNSVITGTPLQDSLNAFNQKLYDLEISFDSSFALSRKGIITHNSLNKLQEKFFRDKHDLILQQIKSNPSAITSAFIARLILPDQPDLPTLEAMHNALGNTNNYYARSLFKLLNAKRQSQVGMQAPSFTFTDIANRKFTNKSFNGKYLFIDFWASWCEPCREENPKLVRLCQKCAGKGIEFVGISIDMNKENWENAITKDKLLWIQACDLKGSQSEMFNDFGLYDIPANFLIDKDGKIVARDLSSEDLEKILSEKLGG